MSEYFLSTEETPKHLAVLRKVSFFEGLSDEQLDAVAKTIVEREAESGEVIIEESKPGEAFHIIASGKVKVEKGQGGDKVTLTELGEGATFGEMSLLDAVPTSATVTAIEDTSLLSISRLDLEVLLNWDTILASKMWRSFSLQLSERLRDANEKLMQES